MRVVTADFGRRLDGAGRHRAPLDSRRRCWRRSATGSPRRERAWGPASLPEGFRVATKRQPTDDEWQALRFAWRICAHVKSNTVIFTDARADAGRRRRSDEPGGCRERGRDEGARDPRDRCPDRWPRRTRSSRSATVSTPSPPPARRRSCSPAGRSRTPRSSPPPTSTASRWSSPASGTSGTERWDQDTWPQRHRDHRGSFFRETSVSSVSLRLRTWETVMPTPFESATLNLRLFELRREPVLREARSWYFAEFNPETFAEFAAIVSGERNASFRMVLGYWDMAASLVTTARSTPRRSARRTARSSRRSPRCSRFWRSSARRAASRNSAGTSKRSCSAMPDAVAVMTRRRAAIKAATRRGEIGSQRFKRFRGRFKGFDEQRFERFGTELDEADRQPRRSRTQRLQVANQTGGGFCGASGETLQAVSVDSR